MKSKRIFIVFTVLFAFLLALSGCSKSQANNNQKSPDTNGTQQGSGSRTPDFGQPNRPADIRGVVKSIIGNEATILKVDITGGRGGAMASSTGTASASGTRTAPAISLNGGAQGGIPGGGQGGRGFGGAGGGPGTGGTTDRTAMLARLKAMSTGEEDVLIPVGIQMLKSSTDTNTKKRTMVEATISDVTADKTITIWLNSSVTDKKVAEFVLIN